MNLSLSGASLWLVIFAVAPCLYCTCYFLLRMLGKLAVSAAGWHAGGVHLGRKIILPALGLFSFFQPLLRLESAAWRLARRLRGRQPGEPGISDVVVEVVPMA